MIEDLVERISRQIAQPARKKTSTSPCPSQTALRTTMGRNSQNQDGEHGDGKQFPSPGREIASKANTYRPHYE